MTRSGFRLIRATAVAFAFFAGFALDVSPAVWQSGTVISQAEAVDIFERMWSGTDMLANGQPGPEPEP